MKSKNNEFVHFSDLTLREKFFYVIFTITILGGISGAIACNYINSSQISINISFSLILVYILLYLWGIYKKEYQNALLNFAILGISFFIFPTMFLAGGGIKSGIPAYLVICLSITLFLIPKYGIPLSIIQSIFYITIYYASYKYPFIVVPTPAFETAFGERLFNYQAVTSNTLMATVVLGMIARLMFKIFVKENQLVENSMNEIKRQSIIDPLTNVYNRRYMYKYLSDQIAKASTERTKLSIAIFDIDKFKLLNDTYGHILGDEVLKSLSRILKDACRDGEIVTRYGGEEFIIIMPDSDLEMAYKRADEIRNCIAHSYLSPDLPKDKPVTVSGGVSSYKEGFDEEKLVNIADENLYKAKESGRNKIVK